MLYISDLHICSIIPYLQFSAASSPISANSFPLPPSQLELLDKNMATAGSAVVIPGFVNKYVYTDILYSSLKYVYTDILHCSLIYNTYNSARIWSSKIFYSFLIISSNLAPLFTNKQTNKPTNKLSFYVKNQHFEKVSSGNSNANSLEAF